MIWFEFKQYLERIKFRIKKTKVLAVHENDIEMMITNLNLNEDIKNGEIKCDICGEIIDLNNIGALVKIEGTIKFICDKSICLSYNN